MSTACVMGSPEVALVGNDEHEPLRGAPRAEGRRRLRRVVYHYEDEHASPLSSEEGGNGYEVVEVYNDCIKPEKKMPISPNNPRIGSPSPLGFYAFGMTTILYNVHVAKICKLNMATLGMVAMYGGATQFLCGFFELINMNTFGCTISTTYGAFWMATALMFLAEENAYVDQLGNHTYSGGFFLMWFFFAASLFASSFRSPLTCMLLLFMVPLNFLLQSIGYFADNDTMARIAGYEGIALGCVATYIGMAFTMRDVYGRSILPLFFHTNFKNIKW